MYVLMPLTRSYLSSAEFSNTPHWSHSWYFWPPSIVKASSLLTSNGLMNSTVAVLLSLSNAPLPKIWKPTSPERSILSLSSSGIVINLYFSFLTSSLQILKSLMLWVMGSHSSPSTCRMNLSYSRYASYALFSISPNSIAILTWLVSFQRLGFHTLVVGQTGGSWLQSIKSGLHSTVG